jgi:very-short-patch-repair endonuclease
MTLHFNRKSQKHKRKELRKNSTETEKILWQYLRKNNINGLKFKRQYSIDQFVVDFYCPQKKLAIEIDGGYHDTNEIKIYDKARQEYIESFGIHFIRLSNQEIITNIENVLNRIKDEIYNR